MDVTILKVPLQRLKSFGFLDHKMQTMRMNELTYCIVTEPNYRSIISATVNNGKKLASIFVSSCEKPFERRRSTTKPPLPLPLPPKERKKKMCVLYPVRLQFSINIILSMMMLSKYGLRAQKKRTAVNFFFFVLVI